MLSVSSGGMLAPPNFGIAFIKPGLLIRGNDTEIISCRLMDVLLRLRASVTLTVAFSDSSFKLKVYNYRWKTVSVGIGF